MLCPTGVRRLRVACRSARGNGAFGGTTMSESQPIPKPEPLELSLAAAVSVRHPLVRALLALTFTTGLVDASSYLGLGHVFTANQTGNVVLLAAGIAGSGNLPGLGPLVSLGAFAVGAGAAGVVPKPPAARARTPRIRALTEEVAILR